MNGLKTTSNPHQLKKVNRPYIKCADGFLWVFHQVNSIYFFGAIHNSCKPSVKHRYSCFTTSSGGRCPPHSPPAREITSPLTPECRLRRFFIIYLKVNAVAVGISRFHLDYKPELVYNINCKTVAACIDEEWRAAAAKLSKRS